MMDHLSEWFAPGPWFGWACLVFVGLIPLIWFRARPGRRRPTVRFSAVGFVRSAGSTWATRTRSVLPFLRTFAIIALIVALARPQSSGAYRDTSEGIAIQMVLDVSGSMVEEDFVIDGQRARRVDAVKRVFEEFVLGKSSLGGREGDLMGMTTFAMYADTPCPLTLDHGSLIDLLRATDVPGWVNGRQVREDPEAGYTSLGDAIVMATDVLRRAGEQAVAGVPGAQAAKSRVMILLTDGANNPPEFAKRTAPSPVEAAKVAATLGIKVYTIGAVGSEQVQRRSFFAPPRAQVDERTLQEIASITGGKYFRATDTNSLVTIYDEIDTLERHATGERTFHDDVYAAKVAMLAAFVLLMAELLLVNTRYRRVP
ncbi:MAG: VWA domain-containing protein [Planctomycetes bacterium]|nr:VWA domain-containing protein [Planctomycetota bacterium]